MCTSLVYGPSEFFTHQRPTDNSYLQERVYSPTILQSPPTKIMGPTLNFPKQVLPTNRLRTALLTNRLLSEGPVCPRTMPKEGREVTCNKLLMFPRKASMLLLCLTHAKPKEIIKAVIQKGASHTASNCIFFSLFNQTLCMQPIFQSTSWNWGHLKSQHHQEAEAVEPFTSSVSYSYQARACISGTVFV